MNLVVNDSSGMVYEIPGKSFKERIDEMG